MEFKEVIIKRRTIRDFSKEKVNSNDVREAIDDAFKAPTYDHLKEWYFMLVDDLEQKLKLTETEEMFEEVTKEMKESFAEHDPIAKEMYLDAIPKQKSMIVEAATVIIAVYKPKTQFANVKRVYDLNGFASIWCAIENLLLSLAEKDIFGVTFIPKNTKLVKEVLNIPPELEVASIIPIGYRNKSTKMIKPKYVNIDERIKTNRW